MNNTFYDDTRTENLIRDIISHLEAPLSLQDLAGRNGMHERTAADLVRSCFGFSYGRLMKMVTLRFAARDLLTSLMTVKKISEKYGYSNFRNFSRAFQKEFRCSPRAFRSMKKPVPDIPLPATINGHPFYMNYVRKEDAVVYGYPLPAIHGSSTDYLKECAYHLEHPEAVSDPGANDLIEMSGHYLGFWWSESRDNQYYVVGSMLPGNDPGARRFTFPAFTYAEFIVERGDSREDILKTQRMMVHFVMEIWRKMNHKTASTMVYTYEAFDRNYTYLYLPIMDPVPESRSEYRGMGIDSWIVYLDEHIEDDLSLQSIAAHFHYSQQHFRRIFTLYYELSPRDYIEKRRLYLASRELRHTEDGERRRHILERYHFKSPESFRKMFEEEFGADPDSGTEIDFQEIDLPEFYSQNKSQVRVSFCNEEELLVAGADLHIQDNRDFTSDPDLPQLTAYWMQNEQEIFLGTPYACQGAGQEDKVAIWFLDRETGEHEYMLGPVVNRTLADRRQAWTWIRVASGKYAVFESLQEDDGDNLAQIYRILLRCSFYGWVHENHFRVDFSRLTYIRYKKRKLYFYVPINE